MISFLLCAGFGTRMEALTDETPKPLLQIAGRPFLGHLFCDLQRWEELEAIHIAVNARDADIFRGWADAWRSRLAESNVGLYLHDDGVVTPDEQLGSLGDLRFLLDCVDSLPDGALVAAGDSLYRFSLAPLLNAFDGSVNQIPALYESQKSVLRKRSVLKLEGRQVQRVLEGPDVPPSNYVCPSFYLFNSDALAQLEPYLDGGGDPDKLGVFADYIARTRKMEAVYLPEVDNLRLHCNTRSDLQQARDRVTETPINLLDVEEVRSKCN